MKERLEDLWIIVLQFDGSRSTFFPFVLQGSFEVGGVVTEKAFVGIEFARVLCGTDYNGDHWTVFIAVQCVSGFFA